MTTQKLQAEGLEQHGIIGARALRNLSVPALYEQAVRRGEGTLVQGGPILCLTGQHTGRSPNDKFIVREPSSEARVDWGKVNRPIEEAQFDALHQDLLEYLAGKELFVQDCYAGADPQYRLPVRVITEFAWHSLFARHMFIAEDDPAKLERHVPEFTVIDAGRFQANPAVHGTRSDVFVLVHFGRKLVIIGGTTYAGEIKKSIFSVMNYLMPLRDVMPMHCSANEGVNGDTALFFGLSGTGKTTLSSDPERRLIGDDEHGWSGSGVFNFEGGCYAKLIKLSPEAEPQIYSTTERFGTLLENVVVDPVTRRLNLDSDALTENTRGAYPLSFIRNYVPSAQGGHPSTIVMLTADAFGVLPPIARLTPAGAMYHFLSGYTAKVAGTEKGVTEPKATFSTCFGAPFMVLDPNVYARLFGERIARHHSDVWLVNTGWTGGPYGTGKRMQIAYTRAMIRAALTGALKDVAYESDQRFNLDVPVSCPGVPSEVLNPRNTWASPEAYDKQAALLAGMFIDNFKDFESTADPQVVAAGPRRL